MKKLFIITLLLLSLLTACSPEPPPPLTKEQVSNDLRYWINANPITLKKDTIIGLDVNNNNSPTTPDFKLIFTEDFVYNSEKHEFRVNVYERNIKIDDENRTATVNVEVNIRFPNYYVMSTSDRTARLNVGYFKFITKVDYSLTEEEEWALDNVEILEQEAIFNVPSY